MCEKYNGWANRETWAMHLWLTNEPVIYHESREVAGQGRDSLKEWWEDMQDSFWEDPTAYGGVGKIIRDVGSTYRVEWNEITEALTEE